jgi:hypothetical protein
MNLERASLNIVLGVLCVVGAIAIAGGMILLWRAAGEARLREISCERPIIWPEPSARVRFTQCRAYPEGLRAMGPTSFVPVTAASRFGTRDRETVPAFFIRVFEPSEGLFAAMGGEDFVGYVSHERTASEDGSHGAPLIDNPTPDRRLFDLVGGFACTGFGLVPIAACLWAWVAARRRRRQRELDWILAGLPADPG